MQLYFVTWRYWSCSVYEMYKSKNYSVAGPLSVEIQNNVIFTFILRILTRSNDIWKSKSVIVYAPPAI